MTGGKLSSNFGCYFPCHLFVSKRGVDGLQGDVRMVILACYAFTFIRVHDNLAKEPSNNKSIHF